MIPESRIRRRLPLPFGVQPWNPDDPELEIPGAIMRAPLPVDEVVPVAELPAITRPRRINPETAAPDISSTRLRRTQPRDYLADDVEYLRDLETGATPISRTVPKRSGWTKPLELLAAFAQGGIPGVAAQGIRMLNPNNRRNEEVAATQNRIGTELETQKEGLQGRLLRARVVDAEREPVVPVAKPTYGWIPDPDNPQGADIYGPITPGTRRPLRTKPLAEPKPRVKVNVPGVGEIEVAPESALNYYGTRDNRENAAQTKEEERAARRAAAEAKLSQLSVNEKAAQTEKDRAYAYLAELKANPNVSKEDIAQATEEAQKANSFYQSFGQEKARTQAELVEYAPRPTRGSLPTRKLPADLEAKIRAAAEQRGLDPAEAIRRAQARY